MNKFINLPDNMVTEMLEGYLAMYPGMFEKVPGINGLINRNHGDNVSIVVGGGAGNEPWIIGYVGQGLATGASLGNVYMAPPARSILHVTRSVPHNRGVVYIATNHTGDVLNFELVKDLASMESIEAQCIFVADDISSAPLEKREERRGGAGIALVVKIAGAACALGWDLENVARIAHKANASTHTFSITSSPGYMPATGKPMFDMPEGHVEFGMGFNGEPGVLRSPLPTADSIAETLWQYLDADMHLAPKEQVAVMVNGYGFTSPLELCIISRRLHALLAERGLVIHDMFADTLFCPQGSGGLSVSILRLDDELKACYDQPAYSPLFRKEHLGSWQPDTSASPRTEGERS